jgi:hypothetical protein
MICGTDDKASDIYGGHMYVRARLCKPSEKSQAIYGIKAQIDFDSDARAQNIDTVDKFQGSECKILIISTCVDKIPLQAADPHFVNVDCSRAQHLLIVVGTFSEALHSDFIQERAKDCRSYIEHKVRRSGDSDSEELLLSKLQCLVERQSKKQKVVDV